MKPLRVGLIGCGYISQAHLASWELVEGAEVVALCDRMTDRLQRRSQQFQIEGTYHDAAEMLHDADLDIVDIATRPETHLPLVKLSAEHGAHILCQKPLAPSQEEAAEIVEVAEDLGVRLMVKENWRWFRWYRQTQRLLSDGRLGRPLRLRIAQKSLHQVTPEPDPDEEPTQYYFREMPRLVIYEFGIHLIDVVRFLLGEPHSVYAQTCRINPELAGEDVAAVTLGYEGAHALIEINWADPYGKGEGMAIDGDGGHLRLVAGSHMTLRTGGKEERWEYDEPYERYSLESHYRTHQHFTDALLSGEPFETSGKDNLNTLEITFGAYTAAEENRVVQLSSSDV